MNRMFSRFGIPLYWLNFEPAWFYFGMGWFWGLFLFMVISWILIIGIMDAGCPKTLRKCVYSRPVLNHFFHYYYWDYEY